MTKYVFLDFEASSAAPVSHPIEIGWCDESGRCEGHLILPEVTWVDWSPTAEDVHGITCDLLRSKGHPAAEVACRAAHVLCRPDVTVLVSSEGHDGRWLKMLLGVVNLRPPSVHSYLEALHSIQPLQALLPLPGSIDLAERRAFIRSIGWQLIPEAMGVEKGRGTTTHRALADAEAMFRVWRSVHAAAALLTGDENPR